MAFFFEISHFYLNWKFYISETHTKDPTTTNVFGLWILFEADCRSFGYTSFVGLFDKEIMDKDFTRWVQLMII